MSEALAHALDPAEAGEIAGMEAITDATHDWMRALTEAVGAGRFAAARWVFQRRRPWPTYRYSAGNLVALAYCSGGRERAAEVREWYRVTLDDLRATRHSELLHLVRSRRHSLVRRWVEDFGIPAEDLHPRREAPKTGAAALSLPTDWPWELCAHCDRPTLSWLLSRGALRREDLRRGHAILARSFNSDEEVAPWLDSVLAE
jgi:hypothetical protein